MNELAAQTLPPPSPIRPLRGSTPRIAMWIGAVLLVLAAAAVLFAWSQSTASRGKKIVRIELPAGSRLPFNVEELSVAPEKLESLSPIDAISRNKAIPIVDGPNPAAKGFSLLAGATNDWDRALQCLTEAIYYEAAVEPEAGQRAVAQVVLNRVRHPLYPKTVCGVVYEGHQRKTGCQFSFTCDGSLARKPEATLWQRARRIAAAALAGSVYTPVGWSTNYHADYVVPYWIPSLRKVNVVGRHIFYRLPGSFGDPGAFRLAYAGHEPGNLGDPALLALGDGTGGPTQGGVALLSQRPLLANSPEAGAAPALATTTPARPTSRWIVQMGDAAPEAAPSQAAAAPVAAR